MTGDVLLIQGQLIPQALRQICGFHYPENPLLIWKHPDLDPVALECWQPMGQELFQSDFNRMMAREMRICDF
nr:hypothetical protein [Alkalilimnicola ehrlichii]